MWDYAKAFHQFKLATEMLTQIGGIVPTWIQGGTISENLVPVMKAVMAMGWRPASNFLQRAMNQKIKVIQNLTDTNDKLEKANGTMPELEAGWLQQLRAWRTRTTGSRTRY